MNKLRAREWKIELALNSCDSKEPVSEFLNPVNVLKAMDTQVETTLDEAAKQVANITTPWFLKICTEGKISDNL